MPTIAVEEEDGIESADATKQTSPSEISRSFDFHI